MVIYKRYRRFVDHAILQTILQTKKFSAYVVVGLVLTGCGLFENTHQWDYLDSQSITPLTLPDGTQQPRLSREYDIPKIDGKTASSDPEQLKKLEVPPEFDQTLQPPSELSSQDDNAPESFVVRSARNTEGYDLLVVEAEFDSVWDEVGNAVRGIGFNVEDSNRGRGIYAIYQKIHEELTEEEAFRRSRFDKGPREEYQIHVEDRDTQTRITVRNTSGRPDDSALAKHLLVQIKARLSEKITRSGKPKTVDRIIQEEKDSIWE